MNSRNPGTYYDFSYILILISENVYMHYSMLNSLSTAAKDISHLSNKHYMAYHKAHIETLAFQQQVVKCRCQTRRKGKSTITSSPGSRDHYNTSNSHESTGVNGEDS